MSVKQTITPCLPCRKSRQSTWRPTLTTTKTRRKSTMTSKSLSTKNPPRACSKSATSSCAWCRTRSCTTRTYWRQSTTRQTSRRRRQHVVVIRGVDSATTITDLVAIDNGHCSDDERKKTMFSDRFSILLWTILHLLITLPSYHPTILPSYQ